MQDLSSGPLYGRSMNTENLTANWSIELNCDCPICKEYVNLLDYPDFWDGNVRFNIGEHNTKYSKNVEVKCPECGAEFQVDLTY